MQATFNLSLDSLDINFLEKLRAFFSKNANVEIRVSDETDETEYLLSTTENRESLFRSLNELKENKIVTKSIEELAL